MLERADYRLHVARAAQWTGRVAEGSSRAGTAVDVRVESRADRGRCSGFCTGSPTHGDRAAQAANAEGKVIARRRPCEHHRPPKVERGPLP